MAAAAALLVATGVSAAQQDRAKPDKHAEDAIEVVPGQYIVKLQAECGNQTFTDRQSLQVEADKLRKEHARYGQVGRAIT